MSNETVRSIINSHHLNPGGDESSGIICYTPLIMSVLSLMSILKEPLPGNADLFGSTLTSIAKTYGLEWYIDE